MPKDVVFATVTIVGRVRLDKSEVKRYKQFGINAILDSLKWTDKEPTIKIEVEREAKPKAPAKKAKAPAAPKTGSESEAPEDLDTGAESSAKGSPETQPNQNPDKV